MTKKEKTQTEVKNRITNALNLFTSKIKTIKKKPEPKHSEKALKTRNKELLREKNKTINTLREELNTLHAKHILDTLDNHIEDREDQDRHEKLKQAVTDLEKEKQGLTEMKADIIKQATEAAKKEIQGVTVSEGSVEESTEDQKVTVEEEPTQEPQILVEDQDEIKYLAMRVKYSPLFTGVEPSEDLDLDDYVKIVRSKITDSEAQEKHMRKHMEEYQHRIDIHNEQRRIEKEKKQVKKEIERVEAELLKKQQELLIEKKRQEAIQQIKLIEEAIKQKEEEYRISQEREKQRQELKKRMEITAKLILQREKTLAEKAKERRSCASRLLKKRKEFCKEKLLRKNKLKINIRKKKYKSE